MRPGSIGQRQWQEQKPGSARIEVPVITRLAAPATPMAEPKVIFDQRGDKYWVSEVWFPDRDGFLLYGTKGAHTHKAVKGEKKAKK